MIHRSIAARAGSTLLVALIVVGCFASTWIASTCADEIDDYVEVQCKALHVPGLAMLVVKDGQTIKARGYGLANVEHQVPVTPETIFQSGSVGKQFTATAVMMLVEDGKLSLDDSVRKFFPDAPESWQPIAVRHLLSHTAGLGGYPKDFDFRRDYSDEQLAQAVYATPLVFKPGEKWQYSNLGYVMLGILIHKVAGKPYGELLDERVFKPLGMTSTRIISEDDIVPHRAEGYRLEQGELKHQKWVSPTMNSTADGSLYTNVLDMARWDAALDGERLLKRATLEQMWTPVMLNDGRPNRAGYGFGWARKEVAGRKLIEHGGAWQGFVAQISRYVDDHLSVVALANLSADSFKGLDRITQHVAELIVPALRPAEPAAN